METLGAFFGVIGSLALLAGLIMFLPVAYFRARRRLAVQLTVGGLVGFVIGVIAAPTPPKGGKTPPTSVASTTPTPAATPTEEAPDKNGKAAFLALYRSILAAAKPCDKSVAAVGRAANSGDPYSTYQVAKDGAEACRVASTTISDMEAPSGLTSAATEAVGKAIESCRNAYLFRQMGMEKAMQVADGDGKPSVVSEMRDNLQTAQAGVVVCVAQLYSASAAAGIDSKELK